ncbi:hypothetical protein RY831_12040 [Noviherbaspirillum sp. CPCC 100848]|uniref:DUF1311 domain-containing protein n=1 Tax=Noviherbaspirillum album TaxID=3080276 RepID=A0ABU6J8A8_9BURK|nr:hypothetical protein [Noviherbaspirillum sp. CPCC 100848]MEC4719884.1 hypothetical protein [Noviherbaspirillum sp. CPCC 100848]
MSCRKFRFLLTLSGLAAALSAGAQSGQHDPVASRYESERAACASISEPESRSACLRDAAAAYAEMRSGQPVEDAAVYQRNALARCQALPLADQELCRRRTLGEGTVSGSVSSGGIYQEYREIILPDAAPASNASKR